MREISIENAPKIGEGAHGEVYRIEEDTIVKVYRPFVSMDAIQKEKKLARWAFVKGLPTAISYDIVKVGDRYGVVYEMLNARSASDYIKESDENLDDFIDKSVDLLKKIHAVEVADEELPDMKKMHFDWAEKCKPYLSSGQYEKLIGLIEDVPERRTLLHADYHLKNIMVSGSELMLIDIRTGNHLQFIQGISVDCTGGRSVSRNRCRYGIQNLRPDAGCLPGRRRTHKEG